MVKMSQRDRLLQYLADFGSITAYEAVIELGILQLAARIYELEKNGVVFERTWEKRKNKYGEAISFVRYRLAGA